MARKRNFTSGSRGVFDARDERYETNALERGLRYVT